MVNFKTVRYKNFLSSGNIFTEVYLNKHQMTLVIGENGAGKCLRGKTEVDIDFLDEETKKKFIDFTNQSK
jgi:ABC-type Mn2+/Zn2+ transport system ATPase subunit